MLSIEDFLADITTSKDIRLIENIKDMINSRDKLGHILLFPNQNIVYKNDKYNGYQCRPDVKHLGSFVFIGTNTKYFHHLINNKITGKYYKTNIGFDQEFQGLVSYEFKQLLKTYILNELKNDIQGHSQQF